MSEGKPTRISTMSRAAAFAASKWIRRNYEDLSRRRLTIDQAAAEVATAAGMESLTPGNVRSLCRDFEIKPFWIKKQTPASVLARGQMSRFVAVQLTVVIGEVERLFALLGETFDPDGKIDRNGLASVRRGHSPGETGGPEPGPAAKPSRPTHSETKPIG